MKRQPAVNIDTHGRRILAVAWLGLLLAVALLIYKVDLHSDSLFLDDLAADLFVHGGAWRDWKLTPAPAFVPDMALYFLSYAILPNAALRVFFVTACQAVLLAWAGIWLARKIRPALSANAQALAVLAVAFATLVSANSRMWLFFNSTNNHFAALLFSLLSLGLILAYLERPRLHLAVLITVSAAVAKLSTAIFLICFLAPASMAAMLALALPLSSLRPYKMRLAGLLALLGASQLLAASLEGKLVHHDALTGRVPYSQELAEQSLQLFWQATHQAFMPDNLWTLAFSLMVAAALLLLANGLVPAMRNWMRGNAALPPRNWRLHVYGLLLAITIPVNITGAVLSGGFVDPFGYRYFMFPIALGLLLAIIVADEAATVAHRRLSVLLPAALFVITAPAVTMANLAKHPLAELAQAGLPHPEEDGIAACLADIEARGVKIEAGIADFWNARAVSARLPGGNPIVAVLNDLSPFFHMTTLGPMLRPDRYPRRHFDFAIIRNADAGGQFDFTAQTIGKRLPPGYMPYPCPGTGAQVWYYPDDKLDRTVKNAQRQFLIINRLP